MSHLSHGMTSITQRVNAVPTTVVLGETEICLSRQRRRRHKRAAQQACVVLSQIHSHYPYPPVQILIKPTNHYSSTPPKERRKKEKEQKNSRGKEGVNWDVGEGRIIRVDTRMHNGAAGNVYSLTQLFVFPV